MSNDRIPDVRDGLTREQRVVLYVLSQLQKERGDHNVPTAMLWARVCECLERIKTFRPDVALLDIGLPGLDGYEVARRIRAEVGNDAIRLIAITGYGRDEDRELARDAGFAAHLVKPVEFSALQQVLAQPAG